ncbi:MAG: F0F1 ATP synthase subunit B, partial [Bacteroidales bacterium]|nr:F0F1 ATP synthase subunit B [Bacteroidales bacterium]
FILLAKFGFPIITGMVEKRNQRINDSLEAARVAEEAIAHLNQEKERILEETRQEQSRLMKEAAVERERMIEQAQIQAQNEAEKILQAATAKIQEEKEAAMKELRNEVAVVSLAIAEKALRKELASDKGQAELINRLVDQMSDQPS